MQESSNKPAEGDGPVAMDTGSAPPTPKEVVGKSTETVNSEGIEAASSWVTASGAVSDSEASAVTALDSSSAEAFREATPSSGPTGGGASGKAEKTERGDKAAQAEKKEPEAEKKEPEPNFQLLSNPARVLPQQVCVRATGVRLGQVLWATEAKRETRSQGG